jgi:hypothetical protein
VEEQMVGVQREKEFEAHDSEDEGAQSADIVV